MGVGLPKLPEYRDIEEGQTGTYFGNATNERRRDRALELAVRSGDGLSSGDQFVGRAKKFEAYLRG